MNSAALLYLIFASRRWLAAAAMSTIVCVGKDGMLLVLLP